MSILDMALLSLILMAAHNLAAVLCLLWSVSEERGGPKVGSRTELPIWEPWKEEMPAPWKLLDPPAATCMHVCICIYIYIYIVYMCINM